MAEINDLLINGVVNVVELPEPILVNTKFENLGYLCYQFDSFSKKLILDALKGYIGAIEAGNEDLLISIEQFLEKNGHCTLVGNFGANNKKSFSGKGAVRGVLNTFPSLQKGMEVKLMITHFALLNGGRDLISAKVVAIDPDTILRENLPSDQGLDSEIYDGQSHVTCWANDKSGVKPVHSNDLLKFAFAHE
jgi:hypothetical protein